MHGDLLADFETAGLNVNKRWIFLGLCIDRPDASETEKAAAAPKVSLWMRANGSMKALRPRAR